MSNIKSLKLRLSSLNRKAIPLGFIDLDERNNQFQKLVAKELKGILSNRIFGKPPLLDPSEENVLRLINTNEGINIDTATFIFSKRGNDKMGAGVIFRYKDKSIKRDKINPSAENLDFAVMARTVADVFMANLYS